MTPPRPLVVASLPARTVAAARDGAQLAARAGADVVEIRLDRWPESERDRVDALFPLALPAIATFRSQAEGGEGPSAPEERRVRLRQWAAQPFRFLDLESARDLPLPDGELEKLHGRILLSEHLTGPVPGPELRRRLAAADPRAGLVKLVEPATVTHLFAEVIPYLPRPGEARAIVHTTGGAGGLLRAWASRYHLAAVFASLPEERRAEPPVEGSQIPCDRLARFFSAGPSAPLFAVLGRPIGFSRSPVLHHRWMRDLGRTGLYFPLEVADETELALAIPGLAQGGFRGVNVTHPFKEAACRLADRVARDAEACGCANTLTFAPEGVEASNTDLAALLRRLSELKSAGAWDGRSLSVIGTGGAARAALAAARELAIPAHLFGRRPERVATLARTFGASIGGAERSGLLVHATPAGRAGEAAIELPVAPPLGPGVHVLDMVYAPDDPWLSDRARAAGATYEDGRRLLVYQAAASFERWWDTPVPEPAIAGALAEAFA